MTQSAAPIFAKPPQNDAGFKLHIAVDFGTDGLGLAYSVDDGVFVHSKWNSEKYRDVIKPKTIILLDKEGNVDAFGLDAKEIYMKLKSKKDHMLFERFKMMLYDGHIQNKVDNNVNDDDVKCEPKKKIDIKEKLVADNGTVYPAELVFIKALQHIQKQSKNFLRKRKIKVQKHEIQWIITVPSIWNDRAKNKMKEWTIRAGLVDRNIKNQIKIVFEPDCAALLIQHELKDNAINASFNKGDKYILVDAGGGTVDCACHEIIGEFGVKEILPPSGGPWGSCYIDDQYKQTLDQIFGKELMSEFKKCHPNIYMQTIYNFQRAKERFDGKNKAHNCRLPEDFIAWLEERFEDDDNIEDAEDFVANSVMSQSYLVELNEEILELSNIAWISMFDQVIDPIIKHIKMLLSEVVMMRNCKYLCLVGGLSCSPYFRLKMQTEFGQKSRYNLRLIMPHRPLLSVVQGAAYFGITKNYIKARRVAKTYGINVSRTVEEALKKGISQKYIDSHKYYDSQNEIFLIRNVFDVIVSKGDEIWINQVIKRAYKRAGTLNCRIEILSSNEVNPTIKQPEHIIARSKMYFDSDVEAKAGIVDEWHFYDTTLKLVYYLKCKPDEKSEMEIQYDSIDL